MKKYFVIIILATLIFSACKIDDSVGSSIQPPQDAIKIVVDTFWLASTDFIYDSISAQCGDSLSMLLGEFYSAKYGSTKAELIVQMAPPLDFEFPDETLFPSKPDSVIMLLAYKSWFGSTAEPLEIAVYELNKATPNYYDFYPSTFDIADFINMSTATLLGSKITTTLPDSLQNEMMGSTLRYIRYKFNDVWAEHFFEIAKKKYTKIDDFTNEFKGFYITTTYGQSTMFYLMGIEMRLFWHYTYNNGNDTVTSYITFPANKDVRQLNKISHINTQNLINKRDSVNYIKTGGGIYPKVTIPLGMLRKHINDSIPGKILSINSAILSVEATEIDDSKLSMPIPQNLLLLPVDEAKEFFQGNGLTAVLDNKAVIAFYNTKDSKTNKIKNEYTFDIAYTLTRLIKTPKNEEKQTDEEYYSETKEFILVPVDIYGNISDIKPRKHIGAVTVRSAKNNYSPMRLELVYSGF